MTAANEGKRTCGEFYLETVREFCSTDADRMAFTAGAIYGQAEKVFLGACPAAMFRTQEANFSAFLDIAHRICQRFGLQQRVINYSWPSKPGDDFFPAEHSAREIWIYKPNEFRHFGKWLEYPPNSVLWHVFRAADCGIPNSMVDPFFHQRKGFNKVADEPLNTSVKECCTICSGCLPDGERCQACGRIVGEASERSKADNSPPETALAKAICGSGSPPAIPLQRY